MAKQAQEPKELGAVLYVDGGCRPGYVADPNSAYGGWGFHGYQYPIGKTPPKLRTKKDVQTTEGYQIGDTVTLDKQVVVNGYVDAFGSLSDKDTNNVAELEGFRNALNFVKEKDYKKAHFLLDSQYVIGGVTEHYDKWCNLNWRKADGGYYQNQELWHNIMATWKPLLDNKELTISWVNGHSGDLGNDRADTLATRGVYFGRNGKLNTTYVEEAPVAKYRDPQIEINRLFAKNRVYFNVNPKEPLMSQDGRYVYHCGSHGPDDTLVGKPIADSVATLIYTKEKQEIIESVRQAHIRLIDDPYNDLCVMRLDTVLLPRIYEEIQKYGTDVLSIAPRRLRYDGLCTTDGQQVTKKINPPGLTFKLIDVHNFMENELNKFLEGKAHATDITDNIYKVETVTKKKKEIEVADVTFSPDMKGIRVVVKKETNHGKFDEYPITLSVGIDLPSRETLRAIANRRPKVYVTTWRMSELAFRYAVIVDCGDDILMQMGKDSNMQIVYPPEMVEEVIKACEKIHLT